jgi:hypothetical protein
MTRFQMICLASLPVTALLFSPDAVLAQRTEQEWPLLGKIKKLASEPMKSEPGDDAIRKLLKERYNTALVLLQLQLDRFHAGRENSTAISFETSMDQIVRARRELTDKPADLIPLLEMRFELAREVERLTTLLHQAGRVDPDAPTASKIARINAEVDLLRMKEKAGTQKQP